MYNIYDKENFVSLGNPMSIHPIDINYIQWTKNKGEFCPKSDEKFKQHLKRLDKYTKLAQQKFPCLKLDGSFQNKMKMMDFVSYVLSNEPYRYTSAFRQERISF